jgi:hypothetical protein
LYGRLEVRIEACIGQGSGVLSTFKSIKGCRVGIEKLLEGLVVVGTAFEI